VRSVLGLARLTGFIGLTYTCVLRVNLFLQVGPGTITSATCDEANCGPDFLPCVGANRRKMNIVSDIARPADQQCHIVDPMLWERLFGP